MTGARPDATEVGDARRRVEELVCAIPEAGRQPFDQPWELRVFAMAVAAYHSGRYEWSEFQLSLIESIRRWENGEAGEPWSYYEHWLRALETVLSSRGLLSEAAIDEETKAVLAITRNAKHQQKACRDPVAVSPALTT